MILVAMVTMCNWMVFTKVDRRNEKGETPLHVAAIAGNVRLVRQLIEKVTALHFNLGHHFIVAMTTGCSG